MPTIVSVCHTPISLFNGSMGRYDLPGRGPVGAESGRFTVCRVEPVINEPEDRGFNDRIIHQRDGRVVAQALADPFLDHGVFVARGAEPEEDELVAAEERYTDLLRSKIGEGLSQWEKFHKPELVDVHAKIGAHVFRMNVPWGAPIRTSITEECPGCGEQVSGKLAYHQACGAIFDEDRAIELGYVPAINARTARLGLLAAQQAAAEDFATEKARGKGR